MSAGTAQQTRSPRTLSVFTQAVPRVALPPVRTRTWFHAGAWTQEQTPTAAYRSEYTTFDPDAHHLDDADALTVQTVLDAAQLLTTGVTDYRTLQPTKLTDPDTRPSRIRSKRPPR